VTKGRHIGERATMKFQRMKQIKMAVRFICGWTWNIYKDDDITN